MKCIHAFFWYLFVISPLNLYFPEACFYFRFITWRLNAQALYPELFKSKIWMHSSLFNSVLNSTASNRKATDHSCASKQPSDAELAKRKNIRAKAKSGIKVYQFVSFTWSNLSDCDLYTPPTTRGVKGRQNDQPGQNQTRDYICSMVTRF